MGSPVKPESRIQRRVKRDGVSLEEEIVFKGNGRQGNNSTRSNVAVRMDLMGFHPATLFVHPGEKQSDAKPITDNKNQSDLGLLRQTAEIGSYQKGWTQVSWGTIPSRTSTEKSSRCLKVLPSWKHQHNSSTHEKLQLGIYQLSFYATVQPPAIFCLCEHTPLAKGHERWKPV